MHIPEKIASILNQLNTVILGKNLQLQDCVTCLLAGGHLLIEDVPGVGKTTLAHALARTFGLQFARVQFTADLMPSDLLGVSIYERGREGFVFHPGPVFAQVLLADEINRASPRTQSALLEAMEERQVTVEGETRPLPSPFFVIATQNPLDQLGTYALPESQLDRFHMRLSLGYPDRQAERELLQGHDRRAMLAQLPAVLGPGAVNAVIAIGLLLHAVTPLGPWASFTLGFLASVLASLLIAGVLFTLGRGKFSQVKKPEATLAEAKATLDAVVDAIASRPSPGAVVKPAPSDDDLERAFGRP